MQRAIYLVKANEYSIAAVQDLQFIADTIPHSAVGVIDPKSVGRLKQLTGKVKDLMQDKALTASHYLFLMLVANSLIHDDHTNVFVNEIKDHSLTYARFLATYQDGKVIVTHSTDPAIKPGNYIVQVNEQPVKKKLADMMRWLTPKTENDEVNLRRVCSYLGVFNPFSPVESIYLDSGKRVRLKYVAAKRGLFGRKSMQSVIFKQIYDRFKEEALGTYALPDFGIIYFDLHTFAAQNPLLQQVAQSVKAVNYSWVQWIVLDLRNNFGGSLVILNQLIKYLFGSQLHDQLQKCTKNIYIANDVMLNQYYDEVILPILSDYDTSKHTKQVYRDLFKLLKKNNEKGRFCDNSPPKSLCQKDLLSRVQKSVARRVLKGQFNKKIIILTDSHCYSACVWTSKFLSRMPNCLLIGNYVSATKFSGNAVHFDLPSGKGSVALPQVISQLHNSSMQHAVSDDVTPDFLLDSSRLKNKKWLIVALLKNYHLFNQVISNKCKLIAN